MLQSTYVLKKPQGRSGRVLYTIGFVLAILVVSLIANSDPADAAPTQPSKVISIEQKSCFDRDDTALQASGIAPITGNYTLYVLGKDGVWHPIEHVQAKAGDEIILSTDGVYVPGDTVGLALTVSDGAPDDSAVRVFELDKQYITIPSEAFCTPLATENL